MRRKFKKEGVARMALLFATPLIMVMEYFFYIKAFWVRYFFPFFGIAIICSGIFFEKFNWGRKYIAIFGILSVVSSMCEFSGHRELFFSLALSVLIFLILFNIRKISKFLLKIIPAHSIFTSLILFLVIVLLMLNAEYDKKEADRYAVLFGGKESVEKDIGVLWSWIHKNTLEGKRIAYTGRGEFYPLFGHRLVNDVFYVSVNDKPAAAHYYPGGLYRNELDEKAWLKNLSNSAVDMLVIYLPHDEEKFPIEDEWARKNPDRFMLLYRNSKARVYSARK